jgi:hypothetical protein
MRDFQKVSALHIFSKKMERAGGLRWGSVVSCHVTSQQGKLVDLAVSVRVAMKR